MLPTRPPLAVGDQFVAALEACRQFLLSVANVQMPGRLAPKGGASDLVQETLAAGYVQRDQFRGHTLPELRAWLRGILLNELASFRRRYRTSCRDTTREVPVGALPDGEHPTASEKALEGLLQAERAATVTAAVSRLPKDARQVLVLRLELRLGFREIGERIGRTEEAVRKTFTRSLARLRDSDLDPTA